MVPGPVTRVSTIDIIMNTETDMTRQKELELRKRTNGATAFDHKWLLFPQRIRLNHWAIIAVEVPTSTMHWIDSLSSHDIDQIEFHNRTDIITSVLITAWAMTYHGPSPKWETHFRKDTPQQQNQIDCGLYA